MRLLVFSHKECWESDASPTKWATDGGFAMHMDYLSKLFDETRIIVPQIDRMPKGEVFFTNNTITILPVNVWIKRGMFNKLFMPFWLLFYLPKFIYEIMKCDAIHAPIPSNIGTIGFMLAHLFQKPLYIRHCGNWFVQRTKAEQFWHWYMEKFAGGKKVFLTTGGSKESPSLKNKHIQWIFSSSLTLQEIESFDTKRNWDNPFRCCIVCRQERGKGTEIVIEALYKMKEKGINFTFDVVGDGSYLEELKRYAIEMQVEEQVRFYGKLNHEEVLKVLQKNNFFIYPTASEGFPKVVLEAMSQGLLVITTPVSVLGQMIIDSKSGALLEERNAENVIKSINLLLSDTNKLSEMSKNAIAYSKQFTLEAWANEIGLHLEKAWNVKLNRI
ncbi:glycosyltransferase [Flavobacterium sp. NRK F7]|uniref:glycosyltransferase n=1 Tax=Flavobacterium sp. NRK F7 TaxID=2954930 RepID=UPI002090D9A8|nr:glycosyltransferase [Flavobacterium sp. NRK F7]MCO6164197.1 glycosyltransferase [Flavobacterium sp. NRK F7]